MRNNGDYRVLTGTHRRSADCPGRPDSDYWPAFSWEPSAIVVVMDLPLPAARDVRPVTGSRAERARLPVARQVVEAVAVKYGVCVHPIPVRRVDPETGATDIVDVPCGATVTSKCPSCAERARLLRITQCRQGWHLDAEPILEPDDPSDEQQELATLRADLEAVRTRAVVEGLDMSEVEAAIERVDEALTAAGVRGNAVPSRARRRVRSTRRRQDAPDLPQGRIAPTTIGRTFAGKAGRMFRPSVS